MPRPNVSTTQPVNMSNADAVNSSIKMGASIFRTSRAILLQDAAGRWARMGSSIRTERGLFGVILGGRGETAVKAR